MGGTVVRSLGVLIAEEKDMVRARLAAQLEGLGHRELGILCEQDGDLQRALRTRIAVERAKRMLMRRLRIEETAAFDYMLRYSLSTGRPLRDEAADLLTTEELWFGKAQVVECLNVV